MVFLIRIGTDGWQLLHQPIDVPVLARLLLHQQTHIVSHQIDASLQPQPLADKRGLHQSTFSLTVVFKQDIHSLTDIRFLLLGISLETHTVKATTRTELQGLFAERLAQRVSKRCCRTVYQVVEGCSCKVTQQDRLRIGTCIQAVEQIAHGVMAIVLETGCYRRDVNQEVGLHNNQTCCYRRTLTMAVQQVQLHA